MLRISHLVNAARASLSGERREFDKTVRLDLLEGMVWLVVAVAALFLLAAMLGGPPDNVP
jgi:hypothetical protein